MSTDQLTYCEPPPECRPNLHDYELCSPVGRCFGGLSKVFISLHKRSSTHLVVKQTNVDIQNPEHLDEIKYEVQILKSIKHPNILPLYCAFVTSRDLWTVYPVMSFGSCVDILKASFPEGMDELIISLILLDVLQALDYLHRMGIIHRAVKGSHILVGADGRVCLTGLRKSICLAQQPDRSRVAYHFPKSHTVSTLSWMAPEILQQDLQGYDDRADTYSVGITAIELAHGSVPYLDMPLTKVLLEKLNGSSPKLCDSFTFSEGETFAATDSGISGSVAASTDGRDPDSQRTFSLAFHEVVDLCLQRNPSVRPSASALQTHSFFKQAKKKSRELLPELLSSVPTLSNQKGLKAMDLDLVAFSAADQLEGMTLDEWVF